MFVTSKPYPNLDCGICKYPLEKEVVIHDSHDGEKHPFHEKCVLEWLKIKQDCPNCRIDINPSSLFSWQDKIICCWNKYKNHIRTNVMEEICFGTFWGAMISVYVEGDPKIYLVRLGLVGIASTIAGISAASLARIQNKRAALMASLFTTIMLY